MITIASFVNNIWAMSWWAVLHLHYNLFIKLQSMPLSICEIVWHNTLKLSHTNIWGLYSNFVCSCIHYKEQLTYSDENNRTGELCYPGEL